MTHQSIIQIILLNAVNLAKEILEAIETALKGITLT